MVKSKWGLALAAVVTVLSSLLMSVGLCTLFGLTPTLNGGSVHAHSLVRNWKGVDGDTEGSPQDQKFNLVPISSLVVVKKLPLPSMARSPNKH